MENLSPVSGEIQVNKGLARKSRSPEVPFGVIGFPTTEHGSRLCSEKDSETWFHVKIGVGAFWCPDSEGSGEVPDLCFY